MALLSFYWCFNEVSLFTAWWGFVGLYLALLVLIIADCGIRVGRNVVMVLLLDLVRVLLSFSCKSF